MKQVVKISRLFLSHLITLLWFRSVRATWVVPVLL